MSARIRAVHNIADGPHWQVDNRVINKLAPFDAVSLTAMVILMAKNILIHVFKSHGKMSEFIWQLCWWYTKLVPFSCHGYSNKPICYWSIIIIELKESWWCDTISGRDAIIWLAITGCVITFLRLVFCIDLLISNLHSFSLAIVPPVTKTVKLGTFFYMTCEAVIFLFTQKS